ncbi:MAG: hypothetical protein HQL15_01875 [Candidatus Omnitrophica bacterium]|nr:hypothetical protein [Candidatus Omnitrophota bacterium]
MRAIPQKIQILKFIGEQGIVTLSDVARHFLCPDKSSYIRVALYKLGIAHSKYPEIPNGIWFIDNPKLYELLKLYYPDFPQLEVRPLSLGRVPHCLELNRIRTTFTQTHLITIDEWWSERCLWALPLSFRANFCSEKIPDAIFWRRRKDGSRQKYFLEYERTLKSKDRYDDIFRTYAKRQEVKDRNVIYICATAHIKEELQNIEKCLVKSGRLPDAGLYFQFITLEGFYKTHSNNPINEDKSHEHNKELYANV